MAEPGEITLMLAELRGGNREAVDKLLALVYDELRRIAAAKLRRERVGHTLQPTALVNEVFLKLVDQHDVEWRNRAHFLAVAAQSMRRILVDYARMRHAGKRGGHVALVALDEAVTAAEARSIDLVALDEALLKLERLEPRLCRVVELRYFAGMTNPEIAEVLGISPATVDRDRVTATAWLRRELR
jgi:RNA polymerase sigma-70 factor, ECF subfamily